jgi:glycosyltransferase involved in cell wall biosynthesis
MDINVCVNERYKYHRVTGVERYAGEVAKRIGFRYRKIVPGIKVTGISGHLWEQVYLPREIKTNETLWSPANTGPLAINNQVVTLHDLSVLEHPEWFRWEFSIWYRYLLPRLLKVASKVITISNFSKKRMVDLLNIPNDKIIVSPGGVDRNIFYPMGADKIDVVRKKFGLPQPYIMAMEPHNRRKNAHTLLESWNEIQRRYPDLSLAFVGKSHGVFKSTNSIKNPKKIHNFDYVSDRELAALMSGANVFIYLSLYEGFGLSVLEAMACGTPVIASNTGGLPESIGDSGYLIAPLDSDGLMHGLNLVLTDPDYRECMVSRGLRRVRQFGWDSTVRIIEHAIQLA